MPVGLRGGAGPPAPARRLPRARTVVHKNRDYARLTDPPPANLWVAPAGGVENTARTYTLPA